MAAGIVPAVGGMVTRARQPGKAPRGTKKDIGYGPAMGHHSLSDS